MITFDDEPEAFRSGADEDSRRLIEVLNNLQFRVYQLKDPTAQVSHFGEETDRRLAGIKIHSNFLPGFIVIDSEGQY